MDFHGMHKRRRVQVAAGSAYAAAGQATPKREAAQSLPWCGTAPNADDGGALVDGPLGSAAPTVFIRFGWSRCG